MSEVKMRSKRVDRKVPLSPCSKCELEVGEREEAVECDECKSWTHRRCVKTEISRTEYRQSIREKKAIQFICLKCRPAFESTRRSSFG